MNPLTILDDYIRAKVDKYFPYPTAREGQKELICDILKSFLSKKKKVVIVEAPTGTGKSVIAYTVTKVLKDFMGDKSTDPDSLILTKTKALQSQYADSFDDAKALWSSSSYGCHIPDTQPFIPIPNKMTTHKRCRMPHSCLYNKAKREFAAAPVGVLNYAYYEVAGHIGWSTNIIVLDECHSLEDIILNAFEASVNLRTLKRYLSEDDFKFIENHFTTLRTTYAVKSKSCPISEIDLDRVKTIILEQGRRFKDEFSKLESLVESGYSLDPKQADRYTYLSKAAEYFGNTYGRLRLIKREEFNNWVAAFPNAYDPREPLENTISFKPLQLTDGINSKVFSNTYILMLSATVCGVKEFASSVRLDESEYDYHEVPYLFPLENRPFYMIGLPALNWSNRLDLLPTYVEMVDTLIDVGHMGQRGIIHSASYANAEFLKENSKHSSRILIPDSSMLRDIRKYLKDDTILVSPAILEGIDLEGDLSQFQIFLKVPYANLGDPWVDRKTQVSDIWYLRDTVIKVIQGAGRSIRSAEDVSPTYMLDSSFDRVLNNGKSMFPSWFMSTIQRP